MAIRDDPRIDEGACDGCTRRRAGSSGWEIKIQSWWVVDAWAGEGGKTLHLAALMGNKGQIIALDTPDNLIDKLVNSGFERKKEVKLANLEDVFINMTGKEWRAE